MSTSGAAGNHPHEEAQHWDLSEGGPTLDSLWTPMSRSCSMSRDSKLGPFGTFQRLHLLPARGEQGAGANRGTAGALM